MRHLGNTILFFMLQNLPYLLGSGHVRACEKNQFSCQSERCIPRIWVCDGDNDCEDGSDEVHCWERKCSGFVCKDGGCVAQSALCDGRADCRDGSDELEGTCGAMACKRDEFVCGSRRCVSLGFRCDGADDCGDGSDEADCQNCTAGSFRCAGSGRCVPAARLCDGTPHCPDGADERDELCGRAPPAAPSCAASEFRCGNGQCVPHSWRCDHSPDCADGSDEKECDQNECLENNGGCSHLCVDQPMGFLCDCPGGMRLVHDTECEEINECLDADVCSQLCDHVDGTFTCDCHAGYLKSPGTGECRATGEAALVVFSGSGGVRRIDTSGLEYREISGGVGEPGPLAVHTANRTVYVGNSEQGAIYRVSLDDHSLQPVLVLEGLGEPVGLAVDWIHGLLYWTDAKARSVAVAPLDGSERRVLISRLCKPTSVAVEPLQGFLFWADSGTSARIERASMDGQGRKPLVTSSIHSPVAISLDMPRALLYWVDSALRTISRIGLDGQHRKTVVESNGYLDRPFGLAVFEGRVFWSDEDTHSLCTADKHNGSFFRVLLSDVAAAGGLALAHRALQPDGYGVCGRSGRLCPTRCVPRLFSSSAAPHFSCEPPAESPGLDHNPSGPEQALVLPDTTAAGLLSLIVMLSVILTGLLLWWWRGECRSSRSIVLQSDLSLKESQDPLVPVRRFETCPVKDALIKVDIDSD
ncbi:very low-density lipoprotein receptor-like [Conger conger]|uniref:very low-density lipoprotein receptor-like n=1 Tax=Conger conger TaxID=82655 RepID=UPI002A598541|nr:very low-density lipoprotein receptor-like [Conger conger]